MSTATHNKRAPMDRAESAIADTKAALESAYIPVCLYCGHEYAEATEATPLAAQEANAHIRVCQKHPMRQLEIDNANLRAALHVIAEIRTCGERGRFLNTRNDFERAADAAILTARSTVASSTSA